MLINQRLSHIFKLTVAAFLLGSILLFATACGDVKEMIDILEGGEDSHTVPESSDEASKETEDVPTERPYTDASFFETAPYGDGLGIKNYTGTDSFVKIPPIIDEKPVLLINAGAIKDVKGEDGNQTVTITDVVVPNTVEQISFSAFSECKSLQALSLPFAGGKADNYKYIGYIFGAYSTAANAKVVPETLTSVQINGGEIGDEAFLGCETLTEVKMSGVTAVGKKAFSGCTVLDTLIIPDTVTSIGDGAFDGCDSLRVISLPFLGNGSDKLFLGATFGAENYEGNLEYVPSSLRSVTVTCPENIPEGAFYECNKITALTIKANLKTVGEKAFYRCKKLKTLTVNADDYSGINTLSPYAFAYCSALGEIKLDGSITLLPEGVFYGCTALRTVRFGETENIMPSTVTSVEKSAFAYCENLLNMELSTSLVVVEEQVFYGCSYLRTVSIPAGVTEIKKDAFKGCGTLKTLTVGDGLTTIGSGAFSYCSSLNGVVLPAGVSVLGDYAFAYCSSLADLSIKCNDATIGTGVFNGCTSIVVSVKQDSGTYSALIEAGLGNSNLKAPE